MSRAPAPRRDRARNSASTSSQGSRESALPEANPRTRATHGARLGALLVFAITCAVFWPALDGRWLDWDDAPLLVENQAWRGLTPAHLSWMFTTFHMGPYQPLSWMSYALDRALWGMDPRGYHLTNVVLHAASAACLFAAARAMLARASTGSSGTDLTLAAGFTALFWSLHPLRVESVAWITERRDCLSCLFLMLTLLAWLAFVRDASARRWYWLAVLAFAASLLAKGLAVALPLVLLLLDAWPLRRLSRTSVLEKWPFFALAIASAVLAIVGQHATGAVVAMEQHRGVARIAQAFYGLAFYVRKTIWPSDLMVLYPMRVPLDVSALAFVASEIAVVLAIVLLVLARHRAPAAVVALASYALLVAPVLGLVQTGSQLVADRYSYASSIPLCLLAGGAVLVLSLAKRGSVALAIAGACLVPLALATRAQIGVWHDTFALWQHDLAIDPDDHPARRSLIVAWLDQGRASRDPKERAASLQRALAECEKGMQIGPDAAYLMNAAKVYDLRADDEPPGHDAERRRDLEPALEKAREGVALAERTLQRFPDVYETTGVILCKLDRTAEAVPYFEKLVAQGAMNATRWGMLAEAQREVGHRDAAIVAYRKLIETKARELGSDAERDEDVIAARRALAELGVKR